MYSGFTRKMTAARVAVALAAAGGCGLAAAPAMAASDYATRAAVILRVKPEYIVSSPDK